MKITRLLILGFLFIVNMSCEKDSDDTGPQPEFADAYLSELQYMHWKVNISYNEEKMPDTIYQTTFQVVVPDSIKLEIIPQYYPDHIFLTAHQIDRTTGNKKLHYYRSIWKDNNGNLVTDSVFTFPPGKKGGDTSVSLRSFENGRMMDYRIGTHFRQDYAYTADGNMLFRNWSESREYQDDFVTYTGVFSNRRNVFQRNYMGMFLVVILGDMMDHSSQLLSDHYPETIEDRALLVSKIPGRIGYTYENIRKHTFKYEYNAAGLPESCIYSWKGDGVHRDPSGNIVNRDTVYPPPPVLTRFRFIKL
ncbi:MAG: hypothetical protein ACTHMC_09240 [Pseudobacter sp.]|uniref:hypothetical protein n=1 Tax=Pseudobacter sp. TaxID=2045420 RepID=UPI003F802E3D